MCAVGVSVSVVEVVSKPWMMVFSHDYSCLSIMGAQGSKSQGGDPEAVDYYQLLEVDENATQDEIRVRSGAEVLGESDGK